VDSERLNSEGDALTLGTPFITVRLLPTAGSSSFKSASRKHTIARSHQGREQSKRFRNWILAPE
jgi:hypothetical protein